MAFFTEIFGLRMRPALAVIGLMCIAVIPGFSQKLPTSIEIPAVITPSPDVSSLGKYGNTQVGLISGIPEISIPLYTIQSKRLQVPISLNYHAGGIKVGEVSSWVGLGWSLNAGGVITRSAVGECDEGGFWHKEIKSAQQIGADDYYYCLSMARGDDGESDYYFYNFTGRTGKFVYTQNNNKTPVLIPQSPIEIRNANNLFEVRDELGNLYLFHDFETTQVDDGPIFRSGFYLSEIISADRTDTIHFIYQDDVAFIENDVSYTETIGRVCDGGKDYTHPAEDPFRHDFATSNTGRRIDVLRLAEIRHSGGKVIFNTVSDRLDADQSRLESFIVFSKDADGTYLRRNSFVFGNNTQFVSSDGAGQFKYRMKLIALDELDNRNQKVRSHRFEYEESVVLPQRNSAAQDWWGYYNGQHKNTSLIPYERLNYGSTPFEIGGGNREPDSSFMKACVLKRITYPTGGATEFEFEPQQYQGNKAVREERAVTAGQYGDTNQLFERNVIFTPTTTGWAKVKTICSNVTDGEPYFSRVIVKQHNLPQTLLDHIYDPYNYPSYAPEMEKEFWVFLSAGVPYELRVSSKGNSTSSLYGGAAFFKASIDWNQNLAGVVCMAGGLRVRKILDFPGGESQPVVRVYKYGINADGIGTLLIPPESIGSFKQENDMELWGVLPTPWGSSVPAIFCSTARLLITSRPRHDLSGLNGSVVLYPKVTVLESGEYATNGRAEHFFTIEKDQFIGVDKAYHHGQFQLNNSWKNGYEDSVIYYRGNTNQRVMQTKNLYAVLQQNQARGTKVGLKKTYQNMEVHIDHKYPGDYFYYFDYPIYTGIKKLISTETIQYTTDNPAATLRNTVSYEYANLSPKHQQITKQTKYGGDADTIVFRYWYPVDYNNSADTIAALLDKNHIAQPLKVEMYSNNAILAGKVSIVDKSGNPVDVYGYEAGERTGNPEHHSNPNKIPAGYTKDHSIAYDPASGNIKGISPRDGVPKAYIWGYNNTMPIAEISNATPPEVFHTSFEDNTGVAGEAATGKKFFAGSKYTIPVSSRPIGTDLVMTYRYYDKGTNTWEFQTEITYTPEILNPRASRLDEIRVYPRSAQMTTYTYEPGVGITSVTDPNNQTLYYEYDNFGRLINNKDQDGQVMQTYQYHYKTQE